MGMYWAFQAMVVGKKLAIRARNLVHPLGARRRLAGKTEQPAGQREYEDPSEEETEGNPNRLEGVPEVVENNQHDCRSEYDQNTTRR